MHNSQTNNATLNLAGWGRQKYALHIHTYKYFNIVDVEKYSQLEMWK